MIRLHGKAPDWQKDKKFYKSYSQAFDGIRSDILTVRSNLFVVNTPNLYLPNNKVKLPLSEDIGLKIGYRFEDLYLRRELQTFFRLPVSNHIVFTVRTFIQPLSTLSTDDLKSLESLALDYTPDHSNYHVAST